MMGSNKGHDVCLFSFLEKRRDRETSESLRSASQRARPHGWICDKRLWQGVLRGNALVFT